MNACNRRAFLTRIVAGTAALAVVARAGAAERAAEATGAAPATCSDCRFYTPKPGEASGFCALDGGRPVPADSGCGEFDKRAGQ